MSRVVRVAGLTVIDVKSAKESYVEEAYVGLMGLAFDRRFMVVEEKSGMFVAQRQSKGLGIPIKRMCLVSAVVKDGVMELRAPGMHPLRFSGDGEETIKGQRIVQVWKDRVVAIDQGRDVAEWFSDFLSVERPGDYRLVRMPITTVRAAKSGGGRQAFHDGYPFMMISQASLDDLNSRIPEGDQVPMNRFRPTIVLEGCDPYEEDTWQIISIDGVHFTGETQCVRCPITTINQDTAERGKEPLKTLATYRRIETGEVAFGRNFNHFGVGTIRVGSEVKIVR